MRPILLGLFLTVLMVPATSRGEDPRVWSLEGEALRARHGDTLEDLLREVPFLRIDRFGGEGLPYLARPGAARAEELLLVVDGQPWRDPWLGENLFAEIPLSLLARVEVDFDSDPTLHGGESLAGVIRVETRRRDEPQVQTRIHLSRGPSRERGRQVSFETPPGAARFAWGLDEFFTESYSYSLVRGASYYGTAATPEVTYSRRRANTLRLDLDGGAAGPMALQLIQTSGHLDLGFVQSDRSVFRKGYQLSFVLPELVLGSLSLAQSQIERQAVDWHSLDTQISGRWQSPRWVLLGGEMKGRAGGERHQLGLRRAGETRALPRPGRLWAALAWTKPMLNNVKIVGSVRYERELKWTARWLYGGRLSWTSSGGGWTVRVHAAGGSTAQPWSRDRLPGSSIWPEGLTHPDEDAEIAQALRSGLALGWQAKSFWAQLRLLQSNGGSDWLLDGSETEGYAWTAKEGELRRAMGLHLGNDWSGRFGRMASRLNLLAELESDGATVETHPGMPYLGRYNLELSRPFFRSDATLTLAGSLEARGGLENKPSIWRLDLDVRVRVIDARFWLRLRNVLDHPGEEMAGFPIPPRSIRFGLDWHLDH